MLILILLNAIQWFDVENFAYHHPENFLLLQNEKIRIKKPFLIQNRKTFSILKPRSFLLFILHDLLKTRNHSFTYFFTQAYSVLSCLLICENLVLKIPFLFFSAHCFKYYYYSVMVTALALFKQKVIARPHNNEFTYVGNTFFEFQHYLLYVMLSTCFFMSLDLNIFCELHLHHKYGCILEITWIFQTAK